MRQLLSSLFVLPGSVSPVILGLLAAHAKFQVFVVRFDSTGCKVFALQESAKNRVLDARIFGKDDIATLFIPFQYLLRVASNHKQDLKLGKQLQYRLVNIYTKIDHRLPRATQRISENGSKLWLLSYSILSPGKLLPAITKSVSILGSKRIFRREREPVFSIQAVCVERITSQEILQALMLVVWTSSRSRHPPKT
jgi:hypothetical protein